MWLGLRRPCLARLLHVALARACPLACALACCATCYVCAPAIASHAEHLLHATHAAAATVMHAACCLLRMLLSCCMLRMLLHLRAVGLLLLCAVRTDAHAHGDHPRPLRFPHARGTASAFARFSHLIMTTLAT
jgi:hypothetical protein